MKKSSPLFVVGLIAIMLVVAYGGYVLFKKSDVADEEKKNQLVIEQLQTEVSKLEEGRVLEAISAKKTSFEIAENAVKWSVVIEKLRDTVPRDGGDRVAEIISYSGNSASGISLNFETVEGRDEPYLDVADIIEAFNESEEFDGGFVPGISSGVSPRGDEILTFSMNVVYLGEDELTGTIGEVLDDALGDEEVEDTEAEPVLR